MHVANGIWLVATEPLTSDGRDIAAGERFHVSRHQSGILLVRGQATIAPRLKAPPEPPPSVKRKRGRPRKVAAVTPEDAGSAVDLSDPASNGRYQRRDLQAEE